jgi:hypothetical protein
VTGVPYQVGQHDDILANHFRDGRNFPAGVKFLIAQKVVTRHRDCCTTVASSPIPFSELDTSRNHFTTGGGPEGFRYAAIDR